MNYELLTFRVSFKTQHELVKVIKLSGFLKSNLLGSFWSFAAVNTVFLLIIAQSSQQNNHTEGFFIRVHV